MKPSKYRSVKTVVDGITFDSKKEATRYGELRLLQMAGKIQNLECQVPMQLLAYVLGNDIAISVGKYICDFVYFDTELKEKVYCDAKGFRTPIYKLKKKIVEANYGIVITEI